MAKSKNRRSGAPSVAISNPFDEARDEMFQHIMRCEVIGSAPEDQRAWFDDTMKYMADRYPELAERDFEELKKLGVRFAQPSKTNPTVEEERTVSAA